MENLIFVGGIHGVGKGTICRNVCSKNELNHLTASDVLKWEEISTPQNKLVKDFTFTQDRLIENLKKIIIPNKKYILDGHYCLLDKEGKPERINQLTFELINPFALVLVTGNVGEIKDRLDKRDNVSYDINLLEDFQNIELEYAQFLSKFLNKQLLVINKVTEHILKDYIRNESFT